MFGVGTAVAIVRLLKDGIEESVCRSFKSQYKKLRYAVVLVDAHLWSASLGGQAQGPQSLVEALHAASSHLVEVAVAMERSVECDRARYTG